MLEEMLKDLKDKMEMAKYIAETHKLRAVVYALMNREGKKKLVLSLDELMQSKGGELKLDFCEDDEELTVIRVEPKKSKNKCEDCGDEH